VKIDPYVCSMTSQISAENEGIATNNVHCTRFEKQTTTASLDHCDCGGSGGSCVEFDEGTPKVNPVFGAPNPKALGEGTD
jgi:hypothetical protein